MIQNVHERFFVYRRPNEPETVIGLQSIESVSSSDTLVPETIERPLHEPEMIDYSYETHLIAAAVYANRKWNRFLNFFKGLCK